MTTSAKHNTALTITVVGFGRRLLATFIDGLLLGFFTFLLTLVLGFIAMFLGMFTYNPSEPLPIDRLIILGGAILSLIYYVGAWAKSGQTLGKTLVGLKIVNADGTPMSGGKAFLRYVGYIISGIVFSLGFLWLAFDSKRQGWHDKIAGTLVIYSGSSFSPEDTVEFVPSDPGRNWVWLIIWIVLAIGAPALLVASLWFLGPVINRTVFGLLQG
jgi:uncharacterized RDD family membrane protein YckC